MGKNAIELLKEESGKVRGLLGQLVNTTPRADKKRLQLLQRIERELEVYTHMEADIFYPAFKESGNSEHAKLYFEAMEEHRAVNELVFPDLKKTELDSEKFSGRAKVLKELVEHHADEEEKIVFKKARRSMTKQELSELGEKMAERKRELRRQMKASRPT